MTSLRMILGLGFALLIGWLFLTIALPSSNSRSRKLWLRLPLSLGAGIGLTSLNYFLLLPLAERVPWAFSLGEFLSIIGMSGYLAIRRSRTLHAPATDSAATKPSVYLILAASGAALWALFNFTLRSLNQQHGNWDAWSIWNVAARFLFRGGEHWRNAFSPLLFHGDYPLLIPASVARLWTFAGKESLYGSWLTALAFFGGTILLLVAAAWILRSGYLALIGGLVLISATAFTVYGASQIADVPTGFYLLAAGVLILMKDKSSDPSNRLLALAGFFAGLAAWTKNEGLLICAAFGFTVLLVDWFHEDRRQGIKAALTFASGAVPILLIVALFKVAYAPPNDLLAGQSAETLARLVDPGSYWTIIESFLFQTVRLEVKTSTPIVLIPLYMLIFGLRKKALRRPGFLSVAGALLFVLIGYFFIFLLTPHSLTWHLEDPPPRLFLHLWPTAILLFVLALPKIPSEVQEIVDMNAGSPKPDS